MVRRNTFTRRALLGRVGTAALAASAALVIPRAVHAEPTILKGHPTWDALLDRIGGIEYVGFGSDGLNRTYLKGWVRDLVLRPGKPQSKLLLTGADGKRMFPEAMRLLLPPEAVVQCRLFDQRRLTDEEWNRAWLVTINSYPALYANLFGVRLARQEPSGQVHYMKWCLTNDRPDPRFHDVKWFHVPPFDPGSNLLLRLLNEREAFQHTLLHYA